MSPPFEQHKRQVFAEVRVRGGEGPLERVYKVFGPNALRQLVRSEKRFEYNF